MQKAQRRNIKTKLSKLLLQVKSIKKQLAGLYVMHQKFTFSSIVPKQINYLTKKTSVLQEKKENNLIHANQNNFQNKKIQIRTLKTYNHKKTTSYIRELQSQKQNMKNFKNKADQIKDLKATMIMQLTQIKSMEKRQQALHRASQKIKAYNSEQKKNYRNSISREKQNSLNNSDASFKPSLTNCGEDSLLRSDISISIPVSIENKHKTLYCKKGHQCYEGFVNNRDQPNGNGRLQICCNQIPIQLANRNLKDSQFYQGQFKDGLFHGFGTLSYKGGVKYVGQFRQGRRHGKGSMYHNGKSEVAKWENDIFISIM